MFLGKLLMFLDKFFKPFNLCSLFFLFTLTEWVQANESSDPVQEIRANYQLKASFFALPITAKISVKKLKPEIYQASINVSSPFIKVDQKETARIKQCSIELLEITSTGKRMGADDWDESVSVSWPQKAVTYQDAKKKRHEYLAVHEPTGFTSLFAHQFIFLGNMFAQNQINQPSNFKSKTLIYTQSSNGIAMSFEAKGRMETIKNKFFEQPVHADKFVISHESIGNEDLPSIWYFPEKLGAFPLKMAMKLGVFKIETNLKTIDADSKQILQFFDEWGCSRL